MKLSDKNHCLLYPHTRTLFSVLEIHSKPDVLYEACDMETQRNKLTKRCQKCRVECVVWFTAVCSLPRL